MHSRSRCKPRKRICWLKKRTDWFNKEGWNQYKKKALFEALARTDPHLTLSICRSIQITEKLRYSKIVVNWLRFYIVWPNDTTTDAYISFRCSLLIAGILVMTAGSNPAHDSSFLGWTFGNTAAVRSCDQGTLANGFVSTNGTWTVTGCLVPEGPTPNQWYIRCNWAGKNGGRLLYHKDVYINPQYHWQNVTCW